MSRVRILVVDDEPHYREAIADLIASVESFELVGTARDVETAIALARELQPDVALLDVIMPGGGGPRVAREIKTHCPATRFLALSVSDERRAVAEMLEAGVSGYLLKTSRPGDIVQAIDRAAAGTATLSEGVSSWLFRELGQQLGRRERLDERRRVRERRIRRALQPGAIGVVLQPIVDLGTGRVVASEALARFALQPIRSPDKWFAEAAGAGLGSELEIAAARAAIATLAALPAGVRLSVNASPRTAATGGFRAFLDEVPADRLVLEVTEQAPVRDYEALAGAVERFRAAGGRLAVDDVGTGFTSLRQLLGIEPDYFKLDITLTRDLRNDRARVVLARAVVSLAEDIGATVIAEGIESADDVAAVRALGVRYGQGYFLGRPAGASEIRARVRIGA